MAKYLYKSLILVIASDWCIQLLFWFKINILKIVNSLLSFKIFYFHCYLSILTGNKWIENKEKYYIIKITKINHHLIFNIVWNG